ncbi:MAG: hypothetical protein ACREKL_04030 [Chthoniobacterales bacterium]
MNNKHIACLVILLIGVLAVQGVSMVRKRALAMQTAAETARNEADAARVELNSQRALLDDLKRKSDGLIQYLNEWEPHFSRLSTPESGELNVNALVKEANLVLLAQRFEVMPNKTDSTAVQNTASQTIPQIVRAHLTIEDDFSKTINWLGNLESKLPIARVSSLDIIRGQAGNDVRMNVVVDIPLARPRPTPAPPPAS